MLPTKTDLLAWLERDISASTSCRNGAAADHREVTPQPDRPASLFFLAATAFFSLRLPARLEPRFNFFFLCFFWFSCIEEACANHSFLFPSMLNLDFSSSRAKSILLDLDFARGLLLSIACASLCLSVHSEAGIEPRTSESTNHISELGVHKPHQDRGKPSKSEGRRSFADLVKESAIHEAAYYNDLPSLKGLLKNSAGGSCGEEACLNINSRIASSDTALHLAVSRDHDRAVEVFML
jgi:hypothetical protein